MDFYQTLYIKEFPATLKEWQGVLSAYESPISIVDPDEKPIEEHSGRLSFSYQHANLSIIGKSIVEIEINFNVNNRFNEPIYEKVSQYSRFVTFGFGMSDMMGLRVVYMLCVPLARKYNALFRDNYYNVFLSRVELDILSTELKEFTGVSPFSYIACAFRTLPVFAYLGPAFSDIRSFISLESIKREYQPREVKTLSNVPKLEKYFDCQWCQWKFPTPRHYPFCNECKARCPVCGSLDSSCKKPGSIQFLVWRDYWSWVASKHEKANSKLDWMHPFK